MLAQESTQRRAPGFRPGTLLQGPRPGGAELATLRFAQTSSAFSRPITPSARGSIREAKVKTSGTPTFLPNNKHCGLNAPGARYAGAARHGRRPSVPRMSEDLAFIHEHSVGTAVVWTFAPLSSRRVERLFAGEEALDV